MKRIKWLPKTDEDWTLILMVIGAFTVLDWIVKLSVWLGYFFQ